MRKILITTMLLMLLMPFVVALPDVYDQMRGRQMVGDKGAPWYADGAVNYFGTGKDVAMSYDADMDKFYVNDTAIYLEEDTTVANLTCTGNFAVSGSSISGGKYDAGFTVDDLKANATIYAVTTINSGGTATLNAIVSNGTISGTGISGTTGDFSDDVDIDNTLQVGGAVGVKSLGVNDTFDVDGAAKIGGNLMGDSITSNGTAGIHGGLSVDSYIYGNGVSKIKSLTINESLDVADDVDIDNTLQVGGAVATNDLTVNSTKTLAVTTADKLTVGAVIIPQEMIINVPIDASSVNGTVFIADDAWKVTKIEEVHAVATTAAMDNVGFRILKLTGTVAPSANDDTGMANMFAAATTNSSLKGTVNTVLTPTLNATASSLTLADGNRIGLQFDNPITSLAGGVVTIHMQRV